MPEQPPSESQLLQLTAAVRGTLQVAWDLWAMIGRYCEKTKNVQIATADVHQEVEKLLGQVSEDIYSDGWLALDVTTRFENAPRNGWPRFSLLEKKLNGVLLKLAKLLYGEYLDESRDAITVQRIQKQLGVSAGTVRSYLSRLNRSLRDVRASIQLQIRNGKVLAVKRH
jgi:predicted DNA-binding transcriptional regulator